MACLGRNDSNNLDFETYNLIGYHGFCREGSKGNLCFNCLKGFGKYTDEDYCLNCEVNQSMVIFRFLGILFLVVIYILFHVNASKDYEGKQNNLRAIFQMLINQNQMFAAIVESGHFIISKIFTVCQIMIINKF